MLSTLPIEIQVQILSSSAGPALRATNSRFYLLYNDLFFTKLVREFGEDVVETLQKVYPWLRRYIMSLDVFRRTTREIVASRLDLKDLPCLLHAQQEVTAAKYIKDSWRYVYALFKNKRLFAEYADYHIDEPSNYVFNHYVEINRTYLLSYSKTIWLVPGKYNLNIGLVVKHGSGLGTTKFEVRLRSPQGNRIVKTFYPPTNINEILPKNKLCFLRVAEFEIPRFVGPCTDKSPYHHKQLCKVQLIMEEIGLYLKSGFSIFFIDISQPSMLLNDYDLLYYSCEATDYRRYINIPLKNFYKVLLYVQNLGVDEYDAEFTYGLGDPTCIEASLENSLEFDGQNPDNAEEDELMNYARFYFGNANKQYFKFNTIYQRRQFINRFGNFEHDSDTAVQKGCTYDPHGIKWRMPILGEL